MPVFRMPIKPNYNIRVQSNIFYNTHRKFEKCLIYYYNIIEVLDKFYT